MRATLSPSSRRTPGPIPSVLVMRKISATRGSKVPSNNHRWLWVPAFAGTTEEGASRRWREHSIARLGVRLLAGLHQIEALFDLAERDGETRALIRGEAG